MRGSSATTASCAAQGGLTTSPPLPPRVLSDADDVRECAEACDAANAEVLGFFFPLNDNSPAVRPTKRGQAGGSHWSNAQPHSPRAETVGRAGNGRQAEVEWRLSLT